MSCAMSTLAQGGLRPRGDVNCDWEVTLADINVLLDSILTGAKYHPFYSYAADVNSDREFTIADINAVINGIMGEQLSPMPSYSGTLPVLFINTEGYHDIVSKEKDDYMRAEWWLDNMGIDSIESIGSAQQPEGMLIKGRGNYTWNTYDKKSFRIKLDKKHPLMGMHSNKHYCLLAHPDDAYAKLKNAMGFELSRRIGLAYTPADAPVEVVLNGQYIGLYILTEKIRVGQHRVNIEEQPDQETDPDVITGGWLLEIANKTDANTITFQESPGVKLLVTPESPEVLSQEQTDYISQYIRKANQAIHVSDKSSTEWEKYIDIDTLACYYIVGEIMDDLEYFAGSCFMHKHAGDSSKLLFGPVWDFGNAFQRAAIYQDSRFNHFMYEQPSPFYSHWITEIAKFPHFQQVVRERWREFYNSGFNGLDIDQFVEEYVATLLQAYRADNVLWPHKEITLQKRDFKIFIYRKIKWLQSQWGENPQEGGQQ